MAIYFIENISLQIKQDQYISIFHLLTSSLGNHYPMIILQFIAHQREFLLASAQLVIIQLSAFRQVPVYI